jgi:hypothetical protein
MGCFHPLFAGRSWEGWEKKKLVSAKGKEDQRELGLVELKKRKTKK